MDRIKSSLSDLDSVFGQSLALWQGVRQLALLLGICFLCLFVKPASALTMMSSPGIELKIRRLDGATIHCSGGLYKPGVIVTAAHCLVDAFDVFVSDLGNEDLQEVPAVLFDIHKNYPQEKFRKFMQRKAELTNQDFFNDIGVVVAPEFVNSELALNNPTSALDVRDLFIFRVKPDSHTSVLESAPAYKRSGTGPLVVIDYPKAFIDGESGSVAYIKNKEGYFPYAVLVASMDYCYSVIYDCHSKPGYQGAFSVPLSLHKAWLSTIK